MIRIMVTVVTCIATLLLTLPYLAKGGVILMTLVDSYLYIVPIYILGILQFITVGWIYGMGRLVRDIEMMTGTPPPIVIKFIWCFILPPVFLIFQVISFVNYTPPSFYAMDSRDPLSSVGPRNGVVHSAGSTGTSSRVCIAGTCPFLSVFVTPATRMGTC
ncbi:sodium-dependent noradrenaline transporter-like [Haliotis rubra]|uniref:sodium-dependent noradrenaline transporter-like n=1 Tax=Haliotis rubra TaxID=36100 RepID=UPI001EE4FC7C|nr:sodium-dependent noradrenaline transporter-like [Haliotis rubra]